MFRIHGGNRRRRIRTIDEASVSEIIEQDLDEELKKRQMRLDQDSN
jgi:hypothetical protein